MLAMLALVLPRLLRIDAYPSGVPHPDSDGIVPADAGDIVHVTPHATFVVSSSRG